MGKHADDELWTDFWAFIASFFRNIPWWGWVVLAVVTAGVWQVVSLLLTLLEQAVQK